jgi:hypothetical protein
MLLLPFLEFCIGDFDLWPAYVFDLLFLRDTPTSADIRTLAAFFYGHGVPLKVAARFYSICNPTLHIPVSHVIPFVFGTYYSAFYYSYDTCHIAQYFDVRHGHLLWLNGLNLPKLEPVLPSDHSDLDCRNLRYSEIPTPIINIMRNTTRYLCDVEAFDILDL